MKTKNKWIEIVEIPHEGKTKSFNIINKSDDDTIGEIYWYSSWRQYCFYSYGNMIFSSGCLDFIIDFLKEINTKHRKSWNKKKQEA